MLEFLEVAVSCNLATLKESAVQGTWHGDNEGRQEPGCSTTTTSLNGKILIHHPRNEESALFA